MYMPRPVSGHTEPPWPIANLRPSRSGYDREPITCEFLFLRRPIGVKWLPQTAVLGVYSVIIPEERIYVLNPAHDEFRYIEFLDPEPFRFDPRLKQAL